MGFFATSFPFIYDLFHRIDLIYKNYLIVDIPKKEKLKEGNIPLPKNADDLYYKTPRLIEEALKIVLYK